MIIRQDLNQTNCIILNLISITLNIHVLFYTVYQPSTKPKDTQTDSLWIKASTKRMTFKMEKTLSSLALQKYWL